MHWVDRGTGTPKDKDEVNKRDVYECDCRCDERLKSKVEGLFCLLCIDKVRGKDKTFI